MRQLCCLGKSCRSWLAVDRSSLTIFGPGGPCEITADDAFDINPLRPLDDHRSSRKNATVLLEFVRKFTNRCGNHMIRYDVTGSLEPEAGELGEYDALKRNRRRQHQIECR